ncbi:MAG: histidine kinase [Burkholderiales bacterium]
MTGASATARVSAIFAKGDDRAYVRTMFACAYCLFALLEAYFTFWVAYPSDQRLHYLGRAAYWAAVTATLWWTCAFAADATSEGHDLVARPYIVATILACAASPLLHLITGTWYFEVPPPGRAPVPTFLVWWHVVIVGAWRLTVLTAAYYFRLRSVADDAVLARARLDRARERRKAVESQLRALQGKVDPSLLFETLDDIEQACEWDPDRADLVLERLIAFLRAALPSTEDAATTVAQEVALVRAFLALAEARNERIEHAAECDEGVQDAPIAPMLLTPLVAQAVRALRESGGHVSVRIASDGRELRITVTADGAEASAVWQHSEDVAEVGRRLADVYGDKGSLAVGAEGTHNMHIVLRLPHEPDLVAP